MNKRYWEMYLERWYKDVFHLFFQKLVKPWCSPPNNYIIAFMCHLKGSTLTFSNVRIQYLYNVGRYASVWYWWILLLSILLLSISAHHVTYRFKWIHIKLYTTHFVMINWYIVDSFFMGANFRAMSFFYKFIGT